MVLQLLRALLPAAVLSAQGLSGEQYLVGIRQKGEFTNRFCAGLSVVDGVFRLQSEAYPDVFLSPDSSPDSPVSPTPGSYRISFGGRRGAVPAVASAEGDALVFISTAPVGLRLSREGCPTGLPPVDGWYSPFLGGSRKAFGAIKKRVVGKFGDFRASRRMTRKHAGVDLRGAFSEEVYPIAAGRVVGLSFRTLTGTVLVKHDAGGGRAVYSKYIHLQDIPVKVGQEVSPDTRIGRLFDSAMLGRTRYKHNHLHLEIRKNYADKGLASSFGRTVRLLRAYCYDPLDFLRQRLKEKG